MATWVKKAISGVNQDKYITVQIFKNIVNHPTDTKYHTLKVQALLENVINYKVMLQILNNVGFTESNDGTLLIWDCNQMNISFIEILIQKIVVSTPLKPIKIDHFYVDPDENAIEELVNECEGLSRADAENIVRASHHKHINIVQKTEQTLNVDPSSYICAKDTELLQKIFKKIIDHPNDKKYSDINMTKLKKKMYNTELFIDILNEAGFRPSKNGSRLLFDDSNSQLQSVYSNILMMRTFQSTEYISNKLQLKADNGYLLDTELTEVKNPEVVNVRRCECEGLCVQNVSNALRNYALYTDKSEDEKNKPCIVRDVYQKISNKYNSVSLLNDFNHLLHLHPYDFEDIYNILNDKVYNGKGCNLDECLLTRRHYRDRTKMSKKKMTKWLYFADDDIASQQLLDRIHCYYFHTFDIGYKLRKCEKQNIID
eukprot:47867_1